MDALLLKLKKLLYILKLVLPINLLALGIYFLYLLLYPTLNYFTTSPVEPPVVTASNENRISYESGFPNLQYDGNRLVIPKMKLDEKLLGGDISSLDDGIWNKFDKRSNPKNGGNMVITGHRFQFGLTPNSVSRKSPLFHIEKLQEGDEIYVIWEGNVHEYRVSKRKTVEPTDVYIEDNTSKHQITLYTCTLGGSSEGREVIIATPV